MLLSNVDEPVFNNVFAVGLREIQELATLSDTEAAELLYSLSAGLDRVSLVDVLRELEASRNRILDAAGRPCQVRATAGRARKAPRRNRGPRLRSTIATAIWLAERDQIHSEITRLEEEANRARAAGARDRSGPGGARSLGPAGGARRATFGLGPPRVMPEGAIERLDAVNARHPETPADSSNTLRSSARSCKREFAALAVNEALWRQAARIEALKEQEPWIAQLQGQIGELEKEIGRADVGLAAECQRLGLKARTVQPACRRFRPTNGLRRCDRRPNSCDKRRGRWEEAQQAAAAASRNGRSLAAANRIGPGRARPMRSWPPRWTGGQSGFAIPPPRADRRAARPIGPPSGGIGGAEPAVDRPPIAAGRRVGRPGRRVCRRRGVGPGRAVHAGPITGSVGWGLAVLGLAALRSPWASKVLLERVNAKQLEACRKQLGVLQSQVEQTKADRDALDAQLPRGGGPIVSRLQAAENGIGGPGGADRRWTIRRTAARQEADAAARRADEAQQ